MHPTLNDPALIASVTAKKRAVVDTIKQVCESLAPIVFANSLGAEHMVLTDIILKGRFPIEIFSLDTGRLPPETYDLIAAVQQHDGEKLRLMFPITRLWRPIPARRGSTADGPAPCLQRRTTPRRSVFLCGGQARLLGAGCLTHERLRQSDAP